MKLSKVFVAVTATLTLLSTTLLSTPTNASASSNDTSAENKLATEHADGHALGNGYIFKLTKPTKLTFIKRVDISDNSKDKVVKTETLKKGTKVFAVYWPVGSVSWVTYVKGMNSSSKKIYPSTHLTKKNSKPVKGTNYDASYKEFQKHVKAELYVTG